MNTHTPTNYGGHLVVIYLDFGHLCGHITGLMVCPLYPLDMWLLYIATVCSFAIYCSIVVISPDFGHLRGHINGLVVCPLYSLVMWLLYVHSFVNNWLYHNCPFICYIRHNCGHIDYQMSEKPESFCGIQYIWTYILTLTVWNDNINMFTTNSVSTKSTRECYHNRAADCPNLNFNLIHWK